ncbi:Protein RTF2 [Phlyctochytrium bullatum]|nr:Protein RTF2 [Phlyctochytrium bullatum]
MGCDGGSIPKRHELVKTKRAPERPDKGSQIDAKWNCCALSKEPLEKPVVACRLGRLYNKDKVLEYLLNRNAFGEGDAVGGHIRHLTDVTDLNMTPNPSLSAFENGSSSIMGSFSERAKVSRWVCPVTLKEMNGSNRFIFSVQCGCALSEKALKEVPSQGHCLSCGTPYTPEDLIPINSEIPDEIERLKVAVENGVKERIAKEQAKKISRKSRKNGSKETADTLIQSKDLKKRKSQDKDEDANIDSKRAKNMSVKTINIPLPDLAIDENVEKERRSDAIKSLYRKDDSKTNKGNYLTMGTFTRYAAY